MSVRATFFLLLLMPASAALAQCTFTPTITPSNPILCPNANDTLSTQVYDSYQWYKGGSIIAGATGQTLPIEQYNDAGYSFTVSATLDGCTEMSGSVLVDGYMFLFPYVINGGDDPISTGPSGEPIFCQGDTFTLTLGMGYDQSIVWTNNGMTIPNESSPTLVITTTGNYSVSAAPTECPNYSQGIGVDVPVTFNVPTQPDIVPNGDELCAYPAGNSAQWYLDGAPIATTNCITMTTTGSYTVYVDYGSGCQIISEPFLSTGIATANAQHFTISPMPAQSHMDISWPADLQPHGTWCLIDMTGRSALSGVFPANGRLALDVSALEVGNYFFVSADQTWKPTRIVVIR